MNEAILFTSYFPPISYFYILNNFQSVIIETQENYQRQTIRNRCYILSANGVQKLIVPIKHQSNKKIKDIEIDYKINWINNHINSIKSAYGKSPFFIYYYDRIFAIINKKHKFLFDLNTEILFTMLELLNIETNIKFSEHFIPIDTTNTNEHRHLFSKKNIPFLNITYKKYIQTFSDRFNFIEDLSILDLIFNCGKEALLYI